MIITICVLNLQELDVPDAKKILDLEKFLEGIRTLQQLAFSPLFWACFFFVVTRELFVHWRLFHLMKCHTFFNFATNICFIQYLFQMTAVIILLPNLDTTLDFPWMMFCGHVLICLPRGMASWKSLFLCVLYYECLKKNAWHSVQSLKGRSHC